MKTPREVLLQRHESANDRLDTVRENAVAAAFPQAKSSPPRRSLLSTIQDQLSTLFQFKTQTGAALVTLWIVIFGLKFATHDEARVATTKSPVSREVLAEVRQQKLFFAELVGLREARDAERPRSILPRPRSERHSETLMV